MAKTILWYPTKKKQLREMFLAWLIELRDNGKITIWLEEINGEWAYVITEIE